MLIELNDSKFAKRIYLNFTQYFVYLSERIILCLCWFYLIYIYLNYVDMSKLFPCSLFLILRNASKFAAFLCLAFKRSATLFRSSIRANLCSVVCSIKIRNFVCWNEKWDFHNDCNFVILINIKGKTYLLKIAI